jgi:hypothetical protein
MHIISIFHLYTMLMYNTKPYTINCQKKFEGMTVVIRSRKSKKDEQTK